MNQSLIRAILAVPILRNAYLLPSTEDESGPFVVQEERDWLVRFLGLTYLPPDLVCETFVELVAIGPEGAEFYKFSDYAFETYIDEENCT